MRAKQRAAATQMRARCRSRKAWVTRGMSPPCHRTHDRGRVSGTTCTRIPLNKNNRLTEIDYINGAVVRKGKKYGVPTPYCAFLTALVHCKEQILGAK